MAKVTEMIEAKLAELKTEPASAKAFKEAIVAGDVLEDKVTSRRGAFVINEHVGSGMVHVAKTHFKTLCVWEYFKNYQMR